MNKVIVEMLEEQQAGRAIFERLGFRLEGTSAPMRATATASSVTLQPHQHVLDRTE